MTRLLKLAYRVLLPSRRWLPHWLYVLSLLALLGTTAWVYPDMDILEQLELPETVKMVPVEIERDLLKTQVQPSEK